MAGIWIGLYQHHDSWALSKFHLRLKEKDRRSRTHEQQEMHVETDLKKGLYPVDTLEKEQMQEDAQKLVVVVQQTPSLLDYGV